ncbi:MAG: MarR family transcriptional regulator [Candidatus Krumholzibacteriia bacterium]
MHNVPLLPALRRVARRLQSLENTESPSLGCGPGQARILELVLRAPGITATTVQEYLGLDRTTVSQAVRALVDRGLLRRERCWYDGRILGLHPTAQAQTLAPLLEQQTAVLAQLVGRGLADDEIALLDALLERVAAALGAELRARRVR